ncbi:hypothetical protein BGZ73_001468 [Actinomortierella ambigua]|nr:hypothetical protein BGZ73_001468 [Actinomortierella ambigua]
MNADSEQKQQIGVSTAFAELMLVSQVLHRAQATYADQTAFRTQWSDAFLEQAFAWTSHLSTMLAMENDSQALVIAFLASKYTTGVNSSDLPRMEKNARTSQHDEEERGLVSAHELLNPSLALQQRLLSNPSLDPALVPVLFRYGQQHSKGKARAHDPPTLPTDLLDMAVKGAFEETVQGISSLLRRLPASVQKHSGQDTYFGMKAMEKRALARTFYRQAAESINRYGSDEKQRREETMAMILEQARGYVDAIGEEGVRILEEAVTLSTKMDRGDTTVTSCLQDAVLAAKQHLADANAAVKVKIKTERVEKKPQIWIEDESPIPPTQFTQLPSLLPDEDWIE